MSFQVPDQDPAQALSSLFGDKLDKANLFITLSEQIFGSSPAEESKGEERQVAAAEAEPAESVPTKWTRKSA